MNNWFFAYPNSPTPIGDIIKSLRANTPIGQRNIHPWEENDIVGRPLTDPIFEHIAGCSRFFADITKLNFNVTFEIGYAIAKNKPISPILNTGLVNDQQLFSQIGIFDTLGFQSYENSTDLIKYFSSIAAPNPQNTNFPKIMATPIFLLETPQKSDAMTRLVSRIKKSRLRYRSFNAEETIRLSAREAIYNVATSFGVIVPLSFKRSSKLPDSQRSRSFCSWP